MSTLPDRDPQPQARAVEIVCEALRILRTRDGLPITDEQILERARNVVTALGGDYDLVPRVIAEFQKSIRAFREALRRLRPLAVAKGGA